MAGLAGLAALSLECDTAGASVLNSCTTYCHGMPPRDATRKGNPHFDSRSSAVLGNHRNHLSATPVAGECSTCHASVTPTDFGHQNDVIAMANSLKGYSSATVRAKYDKGTFFNQTSIPNLTAATCSNASCHFETKTPPWGSPSFTAPANCNACHGFPPSGTSATPAGGLAGSHDIHNFYYPGTNGCQKCHPSYGSFTHGSSAGRPLRVQGFLRDPANTLQASATYSGSGINYLPSASSAQSFGSCSNLYCHSNSGPNGTAGSFSTPGWGGGPLTCASCHADMATTADTAPNGSHYIHASTGYAAGVKLDCSTCHGTGYASSAIDPATHVDKQVNLSFTGSGNGTVYSKASPMAAGTAWGSCSTSLCHGIGTPSWGGSIWSTTDQCGKCHSSTASGTISQSVPFYGTSFPAKVTLDTDAKVGAHTNHMIAQTLGFAASTACNDCHGTVTLTAPTHMNGTTTFVWSNLANRNGTLVPGYSPTTGQCTATYCHGNAMPGGDTTGSNKAPVWKDPTYLPATLGATTCGTCHGFPPSTASGHPGGITIPAGFPATASIGTTCSCHSNINTAGTSYATMFVNPALHINGIFEPAASGHTFPFGGSQHAVAAGTTPWTGCTSCHSNAPGGTYPVAPGTPPDCTGCHLGGLRTPVGTSSCWDCHGASATDGKPNGNTFPNISASHTPHVALTGISCASCHTGGGSGAASHGSSNRTAATPESVTVAFTGQGTSPAWTFATRSCAGITCHGQGAPTWGARAASPVNGFPYSSTQCAKCHGNLTSNPFYSTAIPKVTATTDSKVGAHFMHLTSSTVKISRTVHCNDCHTVPASVSAATHMNGTTNFTWSTLATGNGALTPTYAPATRVCANVYCHGAAMPGGDATGTNRTPTWNAPFMPATISSAACVACHGFPPSTASGHPTLTTQVPATWGNGTTTIGPSCSCHPTINSAGTTYANIFVNRAQHVDGTLQVSGGHSVPYDNHKADIVAAGGNTACLGCHLMGTATSVYPAPTAGNPPDCRGCHKKAAPLHSGTAAGANCSSCHGLSTATGNSIGRPNTSNGAFPDNRRGHSRGEHIVACTVCHVLGTSSGSGSGINHGRGSTPGPVRDGKPGIVSPFTTGITVTGGSKGVAPSVTCNHNATLGGGCGNGQGNQTW
jgi:predicted CxxxxCH...CXXCH cytochrome family protein